MEHSLRILDIIEGTTVDGPGFRTSIYIAGCLHQCPGCHNPQSWDFNNGKQVSISELMIKIKSEDFNVTLTGGDPLYHPEEVAELAKMISFGGYTLWIYTGFVWEDIVNEPIFREVLKYTEVIVDGPFIKEFKDPDLLFRGSSNQRLIKVSESIHAAHPVLYKP